jgi:hypothetical protein
MVNMKDINQLSKFQNELKLAIIEYAYDPDDKATRERLDKLIERCVDIEMVAATKHDCDDLYVHISHTLPLE